MKSFDSIPGPITPQEDSMDLAHYQLKLHKEYGTLVKFRLGAGFVISTTNPETLKKCSRIFDKPGGLYTFLEPLMGNLLFLPEQENKELRKFIIDNFSSAIVKTQFDILMKQLNEEIVTWLEESKNTNNGIKLQTRVKAFVMRMIVLLACGQDFADSKKLGEAIDHSLTQSLKKQFGAEDFSEQKLEEEITYLNQTVTAFINERKNLSTEKKQERVFLDDLLEKTTDQTEILNTLKEVLMAAYHTTAAAICWTLYAIANNPEVAQQVYAEIDLLSRESFNYDALSKLKYLPLVLKETFRMYPPGPYTAREAPEDLEVDGYTIPKGTTIFYPIWAVHRDAENWSNPETFDPDRFKYSYNKNAYLPFGFGARNCPGENIGNKLVLLMLSSMLRQLRFDKVASFEPQIAENFVLVSKNDIQLKISARTPQVSRRDQASSQKEGIVVLGALAVGAGVADSREVKLLCVLLAALYVLYYGYKSVIGNRLTFHGNNQTPAKPADPKPASTPQYNKLGN